jgi:hypothetical protein
MRIWIFMECALKDFISNIAQLTDRDCTEIIRNLLIYTSERILSVLYRKNFCSL